MKKSKGTILLSASLAALLLLGLLAGCSQHKSNAAEAPGGSGYLSYNAYDRYDYMEEMTEPAKYDSDYGDVAYKNMVNLTRENEMGGGSFTYTSFNAGGGEQDGRFVIATANISIQTKTYDAFAAALKADLKAMGGYTNAFDERNYDSDRRADITARVPSQKLDSFLESLEQNGTVTNKSVKTNDVTDEMIETGSKKEALKNEETALLAILEKATTVEDIIRVQDRLTNVRADLQAYSQKLQSLQNQVNYSTVYIDVREVNRITTPTQKFSALASSGFLGSLREIGQGLREFALWFISAIPYLVMLAVPAFVVIWFVRRRRRNKKAKKVVSDA